VSRTVRWSGAAKRDLADIARYIAEDRPDRAQRIRDRLYEAAVRLGQYPTGRPGRSSGLFEKSVTGLPYIIAYSIRGGDEGEVIHILRVIHTARDWPAGGWPTI